MEERAKRATKSQAVQAVTSAGKGKEGSTTISHRRAGRLSQRRRRTVVVRSVLELACTDVQRAGDVIELGACKARVRSKIRSYGQVRRGHNAQPAQDIVRREVLVVADEMEKRSEEGHIACQA